MTHFTPLSALIGGLLIGLAATLLLALNGRIAGVSGITATLLARGPTADDGGRWWRALFLCGLVAGNAAYVALGGPAPEPRQGFSPALLVLSGLAVGYGTAMAGGCTSGHGVCGLARFSLRSFAAVLVFLVVAMLSTFVMRHVAGVGI
jgi:uncharacterized membrane protein YedE/YeeE